MSYTVKELYFTLQGEGVNAGRPAMFLRFAGCNLWSGHEVDRAQAICQFCDTDFVGTDGPGGGTFASAERLAASAAALWPRDRDSGSGMGDRGSGIGEQGSQPRFIVCTGGEPLLQLDEPLVKALHDQGFEIAVETNGTLEPPASIDWLCVSPKAGTDLVVKAGSELKLIFPQPGAEPSLYEHLAFDHFLLQPMDGPLLDENTRAAVAYCQSHPRWRLSLQLHKLLRIP